MNATCIHDLSELLGDDAMYPACQGYKRPDSPSFIFRDEKGQEDSDVLYARDLALDFEEWVERQNQRESYLKGDLIPAFVPCDKSDLEFILATMDEVEAWMDKPTKDKKPVMVQYDQDGVLREWTPNEQEVEAYTFVKDRAVRKIVEESFPLKVIHEMKGHTEEKPKVITVRQISKWLTPKQREEIRAKIDALPPAKDGRPATFTEVIEERGTIKWLCGFNRNIQTATEASKADAVRRLLWPLVDQFDNKEIGDIAKAAHSAAKESFKDAPKRAKGTVFINPDGTRVMTNLEPGKAKAGFIQRHGIQSDLVTMDRVQYEGEKTSRYVIGTRKDSSKTASSYYDPEPIKGDRGYVPRACTLIKLPPSKVMPDESCYVLTIRELERAIIAGADLCENDIEALAASFEDQDSQFDTRESGLSFDDSCDFRTMLDLDEQEQWLYWKMWEAGLENACRSMLMRDASDISRYLPGMDGACTKLGTDEPLTEDEEIATELLNAARDEDLRELEKTGRVEWSRYDLLRALD